MTRKMRIIERVTEAYMFGANDSADIYVYVSQYENVTFDDIDKITTDLFGPINLTEAAPQNCRLN